MICPFCKEEIADGAIKCKHCNSILVSYLQPSETENAYKSTTSPPSKPIGTSIAALIIGIVVIFAAIGSIDELYDANESIGIIFIAIIALVFAGISLKENHAGRGMAIAGLVMSILSLLVIAATMLPE